MPTITVATLEVMIPVLSTKTTGVTVAVAMNVVQVANS
jgi:hypothetical protein